MKIDSLKTFNKEWFIIKFRVPENLLGFNIFNICSIEMYNCTKNHFINKRIVSGKLDYETMPAGHSRVTEYRINVFRFD